MKEVFEDGSYLDIQASPTGKIYVTIAARQASNPLESVVNSVEVSKEVFLKLISDIIEDKSMVQILGGENPIFLPLAPQPQKESPIIIDGYISIINELRDAVFKAEEELAIAKSPKKKKTPAKKKAPKKKAAKKKEE